MKYKIGGWKYLFIVFYLGAIFWTIAFPFSSTLEFAINLVLCVILLVSVAVNPIITFNKEGAIIEYAFFLKKSILCEHLIIERVFFILCKIEANGSNYHFMMNPFQLYFVGMDPLRSRKENFMNYFSKIKKGYDELSIPFTIKWK